MLNLPSSEVQVRLLTDRALAFKSGLILLFLLAALIRLDEIQTPGLLLDREYTSAIFARAFYFMNNDEVEEWRRDIAITAMEQQPVLEPPLLEYLVSVIYRVMGREEIYYSRYLTVSFWLIGGIFMYLLAAKVASKEVAIYATIYYLFVPMGILISRSFQPDSLMMMLFLTGLYLLVNYFEKASTTRLLQASVITALALLLRPLILFGIFFAFLAMSFHRSGNWKKIVDKPLLVFGAISLLPAAVYYGYGIVFAGFMRWKVSNSFMPHLLTKRDFWQGWFELGAYVAGIPFLVAALIGFFLIQNRFARFLMIGLAISYLVFGVLFTYHIHTHGYYHIQLFPVIGICASICLVSITNTLKNSSGKLWLIPVILSLLIAFYFSYRSVRDRLFQFRMEDPGTAWKIGETIAHSPKVVVVARYYGLPLAYYGEFGGGPWPVAIEDAFYRRDDAHELSVQERMDHLGFTPEYFVITDFDLYEGIHQDLQIYLENACSFRVRTTDYLIYGRCIAPARK